MKVLGISVIFINFIHLGVFAPQQGPEINDQFHGSNRTDIETRVAQHVETNTVIEEVEEPVNKHSEAESIAFAETDKNTLNTSTEIVKIENQTQLGFMAKFYVAVKTPIVKFIETPKVSTVLKNIGTCIVNGAMEIVSFYFPAPLIPLIASAAGLVIPFEPIVLLKERMPVTSYRRAFRTAVNSFLGTFDRYKVNEEDPYMTGRFNRRFMKDDSKEFADKFKDDRDKQ